MLLLMGKQLPGVRDIVALRLSLKGEQLLVT
jgi:hypothetical protein